MFISPTVFNVNEKTKESQFAIRGSSKYELRATGFPGYCGAQANSPVSVKVIRP